MNAAHSAGLLAALSCVLWSCASPIESVEPVARVEPVELRSAALDERAAPSPPSEAARAQSPGELEDAPFCRPPRPLVDDGKFYVLGPEAAHPLVRYLDGQVSLNSTCAIRRGNKLSRKVPPVYVNGRPIGFC